MRHRTLRAKFLVVAVGERAHLTTHQGHVQRSMTQHIGQPTNFGTSGDQQGFDGIDRYLLLRTGKMQGRHTFVFLRQIRHVAFPNEPFRHVRVPMETRHMKRGRCGTRTMSLQGYLRVFQQELCARQVTMLTSHVKCRTTT